MTRAGDNPYDDVAVHKVPVIRPDVDSLLAEVIALGGRDEMERRYGLFYYQPPTFRHELSSLHPLPTPDEMAAQLTVVRDELLAQAQEGGWEVERVLEDAHRQVHGCETCGDPYRFLIQRQRYSDELANDFDRHAILLRCRTCSSLYEYFPEDRGLPERLTEREARRRFPGAL